MGARIEGIGTVTLHIEGVPSLQGATHTVVPDRIEAGTYAMAVAMTGGDVTLSGADEHHLEAPFEVLRRAGGRSVRHAQGIRVRATAMGSSRYPSRRSLSQASPRSQAQFMALMTRAQRHLHHSRDDLREPLHARAGAGTAGADIHLNGDTAP